MSLLKVDPLIRFCISFIIEVMMGQKSSLTFLAIVFRLDFTSQFAISTNAESSAIYVARKYGDGGQGGDWESDLVRSVTSSCHRPAFYIHQRFRENSHLIWLGSNKLWCFCPSCLVHLGWCESCQWNLVWTKQSDQA